MRNSGDATLEMQVPVLPYRAVPLPILTLVLLLNLWAGPSSAAPITEARCDADLQELLANIEKNKINSLQQLNSQLETETDPTSRLHLEYAREQAWDQEEQKRAQAGHIWRDCMKAVKKST